MSKGSDRFPDRDADYRGREGQEFNDKHIINHKQTVFNYNLPDGTLLYQQVRYDPPGPSDLKKKFLPRRSTGPSLGVNYNWVFGPGDHRVIYNWPAISKLPPQSTVFFCEGELNANDLIKAGLPATTVISHKLTDECAAMLTGHHVIILEDHDDNGRKIAKEMAAGLAKYARSIRIVPFAHIWKTLNHKEDTPENFDVSDWLRLGGDASKLTDICKEIPAAGDIVLEPYVAPDEKAIPMRDWLYGTLIQRGTVSALVATGSAGKTSTEVVDCLSLTTGKSLRGLKPRRKYRVLFINLEEDRVEIDRMLTAARKHYHIAPDEIGDRLIIKTRGELNLSFAEYDRKNSVTMNDALVKTFIRICLESKIDVIMLDPLIKVHGVSEVDPGAMRKVVDALAIVAQQGNCAIRIAHHTRKANGGEVTLESMRGSQAIIDAVRNVELLEVMPKTEADDLKLKNHNDYFRSFSGRAAYSPKLSESTWYKRQVIELDNGGPTFGDEVAVVVPWEHPGKGKEITLTDGTINAIKAKVGTEPVYREHSTADVWVGKVVAEVLKLNIQDDKKTILKAINKLLEQGHLKTVLGKTSKREDKMFVVASGPPETKSAQAKEVGQSKNLESASYNSVCPSK